MENQKNLITLLQLSRALRISPLWLKRQADAGILPHLNAGGRLLFNLEAVRKVLSDIAAGGGKDER